MRTAIRLTVQIDIPNTTSFAFCVLSHGLCLLLECFLLLGSCGRSLGHRSPCTSLSAAMHAFSSSPLHICCAAPKWESITREQATAFLRTQSYGPFRMSFAGTAQSNITRRPCSDSPWQVFPVDDHRIALRSASRGCTAGGTVHGRPHGQDARHCGFRLTLCAGSPRCVSTRLACRSTT